MPILPVSCGQPELSPCFHDRHTGRRGSSRSADIANANLLSSLPYPLAADLAVLELDEAHALHFAAAVAPTHALLLNVARDQLDRFAEIDHTAKLLASLAESVTTGLVLNRDDAFVARIGADANSPVRVRYFGVDEVIAHRLPELQEQDVRFGEDVVVPAAGDGDALLRPLDEHRFEVLLGPEGSAGVVGASRLVKVEA